MQTKPEIETPSELSAKAFGILCRELGPDRALRYVMQFQKGRGNYTLERRQILRGVTTDEVMRSLRDRVAPRILPPSSGRSGLRPRRDELLPEYDLSAGIRGKYAKRFAAGTNVGRKKSAKRR